MHVAYLIKRPLNARDYRRFGVAYLIERGDSVTVLDLSELLQPDIPADRSGTPQHDRLDVRVVRSWATFATCQEPLTNADMAFFLLQSQGLTRAFVRPLRMLARCNTPYLILAPNLCPAQEYSNSDVGWFQRLLDFVTRFRDMDLVNSVVARLGPGPLRLPTASWIVYCGRASHVANNLVASTTIAIRAHTYDFEITQGLQRTAGETLNQAVFLDQDFVKHSDFIVLNANPLDGDRYHDRLRRLFDRVERELGLSVVIAAHPRAQYRDRPNVFGDRLVVTGATAETLAQSRLAIGHNSTAIGLAVAMRKPVMLLATQDLYHRHVWEKYVYEGFSKALGTPLRFFDDPDTVDLTDALSFDFERYERYVTDYLQEPGAPSRDLWETVYEAVSRSTTDRRLGLETSAVGVAQPSS